MSRVLSTPKRRGTGAANARARTGRAAVPTIGRWPLDLEPGFGDGHVGDPWLATVRDSILEYRDGRADRASRFWDDGIVWRLVGKGPLAGERVGPEQIFRYHRQLAVSTGGAYRQHLVALESSDGPIVEAFLRTTATRQGRHLDIPTLMVFELAGGVIRRVTEIPGDGEAWRSFWSD
jgi:ketosteroid isomerase-like protein